MILYLGNMLSTHTGGVSVIESLAPRLRERHDVVTYSNKKSKFLRMWDMCLAILRHRRKVRCVLIDAYSSPLAFVYVWTCAQLCRCLNIPYIPILHGGDFPNRLHAWPRLCSMIFQHSVMNVTPSSYLENALQAYGYKTKVIPNAIESGNYPFIHRSCVRPRLLWVRSFDQDTYNPMLAIEVLHLMLDIYQDTYLCMVGADKDGSMEICRKQAESLGIADHLEITGKMRREDWTGMAKEYDIFINTTNIDNTPLSLIEAIALGLPVVSTNVGGVPYMIRNEENGLMVPPKDPEAFIQAIESLIQSEELVSKLSSNGRETAVQWSWERVMPQWFELLSPYA